jgi:hypothetical protein
VTANLGPGPARKVLSDLLGWSNFDYIIQGSDTNPQDIQSVTLMVRTKSAAGPTTSPNPNEANRPVALGLVVRQPMPDLKPPDNPDGGSAPAAQPASDPDMVAAPQAEIQPKTIPSIPAGGMDSGAAKTPAEMIQELQQMYQQRRQLQQQQNANPGANPLPK